MKKLLILALFLSINLGSICSESSSKQQKDDLIKFVSHINPKNKKIIFSMIQKLLNLINDIGLIDLFIREAYLAPVKTGVHDFDTYNSNYLSIAKLIVHECIQELILDGQYIDLPQNITCFEDHLQYILSRAKLTKEERLRFSDIFAKSTPKREIMGLDTDKLESGLGESVVNRLILHGAFDVFKNLTHFVPEKMEFNECVAHKLRNLFIEISIAALPMSIRSKL